MSQTYDLDWNGEEVLRLIGEATIEGLHEAGEHLLALAKAVVPLEEGTLERSGQSTPLADIDSDSPTVVVSFDTVYAARQHEELTWQHAEGRTAKYLEGPAVANKNLLAQIIAAPPRVVVQAGD